MNKSKFLKKSLAALLAVMLVVAMVPLSAAAADLPALTKIYVDGDEKTANGKEFTANYTEGSTTVQIAAELPYGTKLEAYATEDGLTAVQNSANATAITGTAGTYNISSFPEGIVYLRLQDNDGAGRANVTYTLKLVEVEPDMKTGVVAVEVTSDGKNNGLLNATIDQENLTINVEAAYGYANAGTIKLTPVTGGTISPITGPANNTITVANDGVQFKVTAGGESTVWTIKVTEVGALLDFTVAGKQAEIDNDGKTIKVNLTMDDIKDQYGEIPGDDIDLVTEFSTITNTKVAMDASATAFGSATEVTSGAKFTYTNLGKSDTLKYEGKVIVRTGNTGDGQAYDLTVQIPKNTDTTVSYAAIGGVEATVDGTNITAVLDKDTTGAQTLRLHVPVGAKVTPGVVTSPANTSTDDWTVTTGTEYDVWETNTTKTANNLSMTDNVGKKKTFVVTAADTGYSVQYSIWYTAAEDQTEASLKSFNLKDGDNVYTGVVDEAKHNVTIEVPFMTTTMEDWVLFGTYSAGARGTYLTDDSGPAYHPILSGVSKIAATLGNDNGNLADDTTDGNTQTITDFIKVHSQGVDDVTTEYDLVVKFKKPNNGVKLTGVKVTAQKVDISASPAPTQKSIVRAMNDTNTYNAVITEPKRDASGATTKLGEVKITTAYSQRLANPNDAKMSMPISNIETNGGIAYLYTFDSTAKTGTIKKFVKLDGTDGTDFTPSAINDLYQTAKANWGTTVDDNGKFYIVVVPEEIAKKYDGDAASTGAKIYDNTNSVDDRNKCAFYKVTLAENPANPQGKLESLTIAGQSMRIVGDKIIGTLPYSATAGELSATEADNEANAKFVDFKVSDYATLGDTTANAGPTNTFVSGGDKDGDGEPETVAEDDNAKLLFVRGDDHAVTVYVVPDDTSIDDSATAATDISVYAEAHDGASAPTNTYKFQLKYADANNQAAITEFDLNGYKGTISGTTINVSVPKATNLKALRASYKASTGATVALDNAFNDKISSGKTVLNCSSDVKIYVRSEDESKTEVYTLKVTEGEMFVDVTKDDWFYEEVNTAANNGWINGTGEGYFTPYGSMTRGQFALIIARMEVKDFDEETEVDCPFPDVEGTAYRAAAKYVYDQGYMQGDGDNFFNANDNITRAQAAIVLCKMKGIEPMTGDTDYDDDASIADWAKGYVKAATAAGIFKGEGDDFNPQRYLRRCEGAAILVRSANK